MMDLLLAASLGYLLGSIPFGYLLTRMAGLGDIRSVGSGSTGATNVLRTGRKGLAAATVVLDILKGTAAVLLAAHWPDPAAPLVAGTAAVLGHCTTIWLGGRGGKGVATGLGVLLAWAWPVGVLCGLIWLGVAVAVRMSSAASLLACLAAPLLMLAMRSWPMAVAAAAVSVIVLVRHRSNIVRLLAGIEPRIGAK